MTKKSNEDKDLRALHTALESKLAPRPWERDNYKGPTASDFLGMKTELEALELDRAYLAKKAAKNEQAAIDNMSHLDRIKALSVAQEEHALARKKDAKRIKELEGHVQLLTKGVTAKEFMDLRDETYAAKQRAANAEAQVEALRSTAKAWKRSMQDFKDKWQSAESNVQDMHSKLLLVNSDLACVSGDYSDLAERYEFVNKELRQTNLKLAEAREETETMGHSETLVEVTEAFESVDERLRALENQTPRHQEPHWACHNQVLRGDAQRDAPVFQQIGKSLAASRRDTFRSMLFLTALVSGLAGLAAAIQGALPLEILTFSLLPSAAILSCRASLQVWRAQAYQSRIARVLGHAMHYDKVLFQATPITPPQSQAKSPTDKVKVGDDGFVYVYDDDTSAWVRMPKDFLETYANSKVDPGVAA